MKQVFKKYFASIAFVLLSGFLLLQPKTAQGDNTIVGQKNAIDTALITYNQAHFTPAYRGFEKHLRSIFAEEAEFEDFDHDKNKNDQNSDSPYQILTNIFDFLYGRHPLENQNALLAYKAPSLNHCKCYIRFEVFRI